MPKGVKGDGILVDCDLTVAQIITYFYAPINMQVFICTALFFNLAPIVQGLNKVIVLFEVLQRHCYSIEIDSVK